MINQTIQWLDERTLLHRLVRAKLDSPMIKGRWRAATGASILLLLAIELLTGFVITLYYVPSSPHAHVSVLYLMKEVRGGALIRAVHHYGAHALVLLSFVYLIQMFYSAAYKGRRELIWICSVILLGLILASCFTGQLLPWDQKGYYGLRVGASVISELPVIGGFLRQLFIGDAEISTLTISRFFAIHVIALPILIFLLMLLRAALSSDADRKESAGLQGDFETY